MMSAICLSIWLFGGFYEWQKNLAMSARSSANYTAQHPNRASFLMSRSLPANRSRYLKKVIADMRPFDLAMIRESVAHIEAEMKSSVVIWDEKELRKQLARCQKAFARRRSARLDKITKPSKNPPLEIDYQPEDFIDITLTVEIPDAGTQATAAFFCMYPILLDLVRSACFDLAPVYPSSHSKFIAYHDGNLASQTYTVKKSFNWQNAGKVAQNYLRTFDPAPHASCLNDLAEAFTTDPFYNSAPIYFYQKTTTPFTKDDLVNSITDTNLQTILRQVAVTVSTIDKQ